jgi:hypothetical protein
MIVASGLPMLLGFPVAQTEEPALKALIRIALPQVRGKIIRFFGLEGFRAVFEFEDVFVRSSSSYFVVCRFS